MSKNFIQYELWKDCNNKCKFCTNFLQPDVNKIESLKFVISDLDNISEKECDLGLIGGEFFDSQIKNKEVNELFYKLIDTIEKKFKDHTIKRLFITSELIFDMNDYLFPFLEYISKLNIIDKTVLCTSYDIKYRFHNEKRKKLWEDNMILLRIFYPKLTLHTQIILTGFFIEAVLKNEFNLKEFSKTYNTTIDYNEPQSGFYYTKAQMKEKIPDFYPTKAQFINFMNKTILQDHDINPDTFLIRELHADRLYYSFNGKPCVITNRHKKENFYIKAEEGKNQLGFYDSDINMADFAQEYLESII